MFVLNIINYTLLGLFGLLYLYQFIFTIVALVKRPPKLTGEAPLKKYAIMVCGRNEGNVIGDLINCIKNQTYPYDHLKIFVMADNCTDNTAQVARDAGAVVYERNNQQVIGKSYALEELLGHIKEEYPDEFDGFFVFDADNILKTDYIEKMHLTLAAGNDMATSYRNSKNYGSSWVTAAHGLWFLRESRYLNEARYTMGCSCAISGTGYVFKKEVLDEFEGNWPFHFMTEDVQFSVYRVLHGKKIGYCAEAEFYDEQPLTLRQSCIQRKRWAKGNLQVFWHYKKELIKGFFKGNFSCYDMLLAAIPAFILTALSMLCAIVSCIVNLCTHPSVMGALFSIIMTIGSLYGGAFAMGLVALITEWDRIAAKNYQKIMYLFSFPLFMLTYLPLVFIAMFSKASWEPIPHTESVQQLKEKGAMHVKDY
ncbi:MAG: glycosyltransferase family 2 protein [Lachnospiraceae bacterium]|nr:glycosyltransferase family 2 protein [Candidatus Merdinaster equi]